MSLSALCWAKAQRLPNQPTAKLLLLLLADAHNDVQGGSWYSNTTISELAGISLATTKRTLKYLEERGLLTRHARTHASGAQTSNFIVLHIAQPQQSAEEQQDEPPGGLSMSQGGAHDEPPMNLLLETTESSPPKSPVLGWEEDFEDLWHSHNHQRGNKQPALVAYMKARRMGTDHRTIIDGWLAYIEANGIKEGAVRATGAFTGQNLSTFINQRGWEATAELQLITYPTQDLRSVRYY